MGRVLKSVLGVSLLFLGGTGGGVWGQSAGVSPSDCVQVRYITGLWLSTSGKWVVSLVKTPVIERNRNDYELFIRSVEDKSLSLGKRILSAAAISDVKWLGDDRRVALLVGDTDATKRLVLLDTSTGKAEPLSGTHSAVESYGIDSSGTVAAYAVSDSRNAENKPPGMREEDIENGYRIAPGISAVQATDIRSIYVLRRSGSGEWSPPSLATIENPFTHIRTSRLPYARSLSLSPNGRRLLFNYYSDAIPEEWKQDSVMKPFVNTGRFDIMVLYDLDTAKTSLAFNSLYPASTPLWSSDSGSFLVNSPSPSGSRWQAVDVADHRESVADANLFEVNVRSGQVQEISRHVLFHHEGPLSWLPSGDVILRVGFATVARLHRFEDSWKEIERIDFARSEEDRVDLLASNGRDILGTHENITTPPELVDYKVGKKQFHQLTNLNPQLNRAAFASVQMVHWTTRDGLDVSGSLFMPPNFDPEKRYPLVIQTKGDSGWFACDSGINHDPSFAPQPIATAGMMYLIRRQSIDWKFQDDLDSRPKGYPGSIGEAVQQMDIWDSAVDMLDKRGMIDSSKVGIIGFSRTGWQVEFDLVHAHTRYAAATATDNVEYSLSEYWLAPWTADDTEHMYDGPPYGQSLTNWEKYSISFNLAKVHTPLLIEAMGYGSHEDLPFKRSNKVPINLAVCLEITTGLSRLGKPFEMYYYPDEQHQPDHPKARVASLQRNLDWYRFWLQGYEDSTPSKKDQYVRWRALRKMQDTDLRSDDSTPELGLVIRR